MADYAKHSGTSCYRTDCSIIKMLWHQLFVLLGYLIYDHLTYLNTIQ